MLVFEISLSYLPVSWDNLLVFGVTLILENEMIWGFLKCDCYSLKNRDSLWVVAKVQEQCLLDTQKGIIFIDFIYTNKDIPHCIKCKKGYLRGLVW